MATNATNAEGGTSASGNCSLLGGENTSDNVKKARAAQADIKIPNHVDLRLAEIRDVLIDEIFMIFVIALQAANGLRNCEDIEALADLRRLWLRASRVSVPAAELKTLIARQGRVAQ